MIKRILRIEPPYFVAVFLALILWYISSIIPGFQGKAPDMVLVQLGLHFGYLNDIFDYPWLNPVFWTLAIEFQFYLIISLFFPLIASTRILYRLGTVSLFISLMFILPQSMFVFHFLCLFIIGILTFQYIVKIVTLYEYFIMLSIVSLILYQTMGFVIFLVSIVTALMISFLRIKKITLLSYLGAISYSLYLVHIPIGGKIVNLGKRWIDNEIGFLMLSIVGVLVSIFVAFLLYRYVEKPVQTWSSSIRYKST